MTNLPSMEQLLAAMATAGGMVITYASRPDYTDMVDAVVVLTSPTSDRLCLMAGDDSGDVGGPILDRQTVTELRDALTEWLDR